MTMILAHYGRWVPLDKVRLDCGVSRDGSKASYVVKAAEGYGLYAQGLRVTPESIKELKFPLIAFWNLNHFVVVEGFDKKRWFLNDLPKAHAQSRMKNSTVVSVEWLLPLTRVRNFRKEGRNPGFSIR